MGKTVCYFHREEDLEADCAQAHAIVLQDLLIAYARLPQVEVEHPDALSNLIGHDALTLQTFQGFGIDRVKLTC